MKIGKKVLLILVLLSILCSGCSKEEEKRIEPIPKKIETDTPTESRQLIKERVDYILGNLTSKLRDMNFSCFPDHIEM